MRPVERPNRPDGPQLSQWDQRCTLILLRVLYCNMLIPYQVRQVKRFYPCL
jgi:hypothetical protein